ncbi:A/G-specific adenine glycosylase [Pseudidiomarina mangrovi]|uniref:A/G-specific adenine glycosylase n=1 Tax=Pseudidiomarina mangrovi TaxID=2487133 RepID=UPI000FCA76A4|nr:A/G-specific adenine glycosylase [Pseudidiomarina mangrovi]CAI8167959.1 MAG: Adenine DNA glycosylase [Pseudidiomarina mangrovi]
MQQSLETFTAVLSAEQFADTVIQWQKQHGRNDLPWQTDADPYHVLVSELMLQQTQVSTVIPYFQRWLSRFPTVQQLAAASTDEVMALWQGLGYYSRARNLHRAAQQICRDYHGNIPSEANELREIAGIGAYTAGAIRAFAYDRDGVIVDGNVKRLFSRFFAIAGDLSTSAQQRLLWQLAEHYTPSSNNRRYAQGLLDLGATICTPRQPQCYNCPLKPNCQAVKYDRVDELPQRKTKAAIPTRHGIFLWQVDQHGVLLEQRPTTGIWPSLWCLPELTADSVSHAEASFSQHGTFKHTFSHYKLIAQVVTHKPNQPHVAHASATAIQRQVQWHELSNIGLPAPIAKYLRQHLPSPLSNT